MSRFEPEQPTFRIPAMRPHGWQEDATLILPAQRPGHAPAKPIVNQLLNKVPQVTLLFWIIKLLTTAFGESTSDYLVHRFDPVQAVVAGGIVFAVALVLQLVVRRYIAGVYWLAVAMVALFGTMCADVVHIVLGVPYLISTIGFAIALGAIFFIWYQTEKTLSIHSITTTRREIFYWATVIATFALGTATGDLTAYTAHLGFLSSGVLFIVLFAMPAVAYFVFHLNEVVAFWWAYILTRPIGASFADWTGKTVGEGGIGLGQSKVSLILGALIICLVGAISIARNGSNTDHA
jgi:uncharacterized membrane-anchored protein